MWINPYQKSDEVGIILILFYKATEVWKMKKCG